jgi:tripartite ATP-independent transporter DctP family solute receptor
VNECVTKAANLPDASGDKPATIIFSGGSFEAINEAENVFKQAVEQLSGGSVAIDWHPYNELGADLDVVTNVQFGDIGIGISSSSPLTTMLPNMSIFDAYYLINDQQQAYDVMDGEIGQKLDSDSEAIGMKIIMWWENGWRDLTCNKEVKSLNDLKGMKIRTMENDLQMAAWSALGANPTPMSFGEVYTALQQGTIDGQENPVGIISSNSFMDIQKYLVMTNHVYTPIPVFINLDLYNSLTDAQKAVIDYVSGYVQSWQRSRNIELNNQIMSGFQSSGVNVIQLDDATIQSFQDAVKNAGVYDKVKSSMTNPELLDTLMSMGK